VEKSTKVGKARQRQKTGKKRGSSGQFTLSLRRKNVSRIRKVRDGKEIRRGRSRVAEGGSLK